VQTPPRYTEKEAVTLSTRDVGLFTKFGDAQDIIALLEQTPSEERYEQLLAAGFPSFADIRLLRITRLPTRQRQVGMRYSSIRLRSAGKIWM